MPFNVSVFCIETSAHVVSLTTFECLRLLLLIVGFILNGIVLNRFWKVSFHTNAKLLISHDLVTNLLPLAYLFIHSTCKLISFLTCLEMRILHDYVACHWVHSILLGVAFQG